VYLLRKPGRPVLVDDRVDIVAAAPAVAVAGTALSVNLSMPPSALVVVVVVVVVVAAAAAAAAAGGVEDVVYAPRA
jgi:hypothetical protein